MKIQTQLVQQNKRISFIILKIWFVYLIVTGLLIGIGKYVYNIPAGHFTRDANATLHGNFYIGAISNLVIIVWTVTATLCIFSSIYLKRHNPDSPFRLFLLHGGILTTLLLLDDVYMWHEQMFPVFLGISSIVIYAGYFIYTLYFLIRFKKVIFKTEYLILLSSILLLSLSVLIDVIVDSKRFNASLLNITGLRLIDLNEISMVLEDTFKGLGIITWLIYFSRVTFLNLLPAVKNTVTYTSKRKSITLVIPPEKRRAPYRTDISKSKPDRSANR